MSIGSSNNFFQLDKNQVNWFYFITAFFAFFMAWAMLRGYNLVQGIPFLGAVLLLFIYKIDSVAFLAVLLTPLSLNLAETSIGIGVSLPSEPLMFALFIIYWLKVWSEGGLDKRILKHPVTIMILLHLLWYAVTTYTSTMVVVSVKSTLARFTYVSVFYFMFVQIFSKPENIYRFLWIYMIPLLIVIAYTILNQAAEGFTEDIAHVAMTPFYNDHTAYAAALCFFIPVTLALSFDQSKSKSYRSRSFLVFVILVTAVVLSYTRAAWVGLIGALCCYFVFLFRVKAVIVYTGIISVVLLYIVFSNDITMYLERNDEVSSTDYSAHVQSIGNISTDDSNVERLNRWASAIRMFKEKPILGFGPGTYMFQYAPFQKYSERSGISTNFATGGGSHSEYLGPLSEQGILGPVLFILIGAVSIHRASRFIKYSSNKNQKLLAKGILLGLITYFVQGMLNYFLDTEKISVPFWGFIAALVALEIYQKDKENNKSGNLPVTK